MIYISISQTGWLTVCWLENSLQWQPSYFLRETGLVVAPREKQSFQRKGAQAWRLMQMCSPDTSGCVDQWDGAGAAATALSQRCAWSGGSGIPAFTGWWQSHCTRSADTGTTLRPWGDSASGRLLVGFNCLESRFYHGLVLDGLSALPSSTYRFSISSLLLPSTHRSGHINMRIIEAETPGTSITLNHFCWTQLSTCRWRDSAEHLCKCYFFLPILNMCKVQSVSLLAWIALMGSVSWITRCYKQTTS